MGCMSPELKNTLVQVRKMKTKTRAGLAPALALRRFAAVAAVLLAFCLVFMMPAGAVDGISWIEVSSFDDLKSNLSAGKSVKLMSDIEITIPTTGSAIEITKDLKTTLDLNGHTITVLDEANSGNVQFIKTGGDFTLTDSSEEKQGTISMSATKNREWNSLSAILVTTIQEGNLIINAGKLTHNGGTDMAYVIDVQSNGQTGCVKLVVDDGTLSSTYIAIRGFANAANTEGYLHIIINGGSISGQSRAIWIQQPNEKVGNQYIVEINAGEITGGKYALDFSLGNTGSDKTYVKVNDGLLTNNDETSATIQYRISGSVTDVSNHKLIVSGKATIKNSASGPTVTSTGFTKSPSIEFTDMDITGPSEVFTNEKFNGKFAVPAIGKSYEWMVDEEIVAKTTKNTYTHIFEPVGGAMPYEKKVSVKVILSDKYSITTEPITVTVPAKFGITYNSGEGSGTMNDDFAYSDNNVIVLPECTFTAPENSVFKAWKIDSQEYVAGTEVTITKDTTVTAVWNKIGEAVTVKPTISVEITVDKDSQTTISIPTAEADVAATTVVFSKEENKATVTDTSTGVQMVVNFDGEANKNEGVVSGTVTSVEVKYPEAPAESEGDIKQEVKFVMGTAAEQPPEITSEKKQDVVDKVKKQEQRANVLAMITATRDKLDDLNKNISSVTITFRVHASLISNPNNLQGYHVDDKTGVNPVGSRIDKEGEYYKITLTTTEYGFSSYVLVEEPQKSSGSATDTGSGNYQYYPRSVPTDGIISFGTSKVVTGMELPAGSDGTVTLNIKPTFTMPENGYYAFEIDAPGYNPDAKINGGLTFQIPVSELEAAGFTAEDIVLFHGTAGEDGKITWEALPTNLVKNENGIAYYKAAINGCSPFYIGFVKDGAIINTEVVDPVTPETPVTPDEPEVLPPADEPQDEPTEEPASPAPVLAVLAGLGAVAALRRK